MPYAYERRRAVKNAAPQVPSAVRERRPTPQSIPNSAFQSASGGGMGRDTLDHAMRDKMSARFGSDYRDAGAEAEADRIGSRFSGASGVEDLKEKMGAALGADFSGVRFHTGAEASAMAAASQAEAFTSGRDIYLGGSFDAATAAHEMVHTVQQGAVQAAAPVMSAPAGAVQYKTWNPFKRALKAHRKAVDQYNNYTQDFKDMSWGQRTLWAAKNPLAWLRGGSKDSMADTAARNAKDKELDDKAKLVAGKLSDDDKRYAQPAAGTTQTTGTTQKTGNSKYTTADAVKDKGLETLGTVKDTASLGLDAVNNLTGDMGMDTGLSMVGTPIDTLRTVQDTVNLINSPIKDPKMFRENKDLWDKLPKKINMKGLDTAGKVATGIGIASDAAGFLGDAAEANQERKQGNYGGMVKSGINAAADAVSAIGGGVSLVPGLDVVASGASGVANTMKATASFGSAVGNGITQGRLWSRGKGYENRMQELQAKKDPLNEDEKYEIQRARAVKQGKGAARIRRNEDIVSGVASSARAAGNFAAMGLTLGGVPGGSAAANLAGSLAGAVTSGVGGLVMGRQKSAFRKNTVEEELNVQDKTQAFREGRLGVSKEDAAKMSDKEIRKVLLKSMGFHTGKRKEAFNEITQSRADALTERANKGETEEVGIMKDMFLSKVDDGSGNKAYSAEGVAAKLGKEDMDPENVFQEKADARRARKKKKNP